jgi:hypothetical protein
MKNIALVHPRAKSSSHIALKGECFSSSILLFFFFGSFMQKNMALVHPRENKMRH